MAEPRPVTGASLRGLLADAHARNDSRARSSSVRCVERVSMDDVDSSSSASEQEEDEGWNGQGKGDASRNATSYLDANSTEPQGQSGVEDVHELTSKYSSLAMRDSQNKEQFVKEITRLLPEINLQIEDCFQKAKNSLGGAAPDDLIREEVSKRIWSHKLMEVHNRLGRREVGDLPSRYVSARANSLLSAQHASELSSKGYTVVDNIVQGQDLQELLEQVRDLRATMRSTVQKNLGTRDDEIAWYTEDEIAGKDQKRMRLREMVVLQKSMAHAVMEKCGIPLRVPRRVMCSCYPGEGAKYVRHRDNSVSLPEGTFSNPREITCIIYLNPEDWQAERDGGCLRMHLAAKVDNNKGCPDNCSSRDGACHLDIEPQAGRMVLFKSKEILHEVLPAYRTRMALTLWIFGEPDNVSTQG